MAWPYDDEIPEAPEGFTESVDPGTGVPAEYTAYTSGLATTFGYNDPEDTGVGAWGDITNDPNAYGVALPAEELRRHFGDPDAAHGQIVEVIGPNGQSVFAPIVDKGPAPWVTARQGPTIDVTEGVRRDLGGTGMDPVSYRVIPAPEGFTETVSQPSTGAGGAIPEPPEGFTEPAINIVDAVDPSAPYMAKPRDPSGISRIIMHGNVGMDFDELIKYGRQIDPERGFAPGYHFYIARDGTVKQGAPVDRITNHTLGENADSIGIVIDGADNGQMPTPEQEMSAKILVSQLGTQYGIDPKNVFGHGELQPERRDVLEGGHVAQDIREQGYFGGGPTAPGQEIPPPPEGFTETVIRPQDVPQKLPTRQEQAAANRDRLLTAIQQTEKAGYKVPHFIGTPDEPEGDRGPTMDMENLVAALRTQENDLVSKGDQATAGRVAEARAYWEDVIKTQGMSAEQWRKQTGEEEPQYPKAPPTSLETFSQWGKDFAFAKQEYTQDQQEAGKPVDEAKATAAAFQKATSKITNESAKALGLRNAAEAKRLFKTLPSNIMEADAETANRWFTSALRDISPEMARKIPPAGFKPEVGLAQQMQAVRQLPDELPRMSALDADRLGLKRWRDLESGFEVRRAEEPEVRPAIPVHGGTPSPTPLVPKGFVPPKEEPERIPPAPDVLPEWQKAPPEAPADYLPEWRPPPKGVIKGGQAEFTNALGMVGRGASSEGLLSILEGGYAAAAAALPEGKIRQNVINQRDQVAAMRERVRTKNLPVDKEFAESNVGGILSGAGQLLATLPAYAVPGLGPVTGALQLWDEARQDYKETMKNQGKPVDEDQAARAALKYFGPATLVDYVSDKLLIGRFLQGSKTGLTVGKVLTDFKDLILAGGVSEGLQQFWLNKVANWAEKYDPNRTWNQDVKDSFIVGAGVGGAGAVATTAERARQAPAAPVPAAPGPALSAAELAAQKPQPAPSFAEAPAAAPTTPVTPLAQPVSQPAALTAAAPAAKAKPAELKTFAELPAGLGIPVGGTAPPAPEAAAAMARPTTPEARQQAEAEAETRKLAEEALGHPPATEEELDILEQRFAKGFAARGAPAGPAAKAAPTTAAVPKGAATLEEWAAQPEPAKPAAEAAPTPEPVKRSLLGRILGAIPGQAQHPRYEAEQARIESLTGMEVLQELRGTGQGPDLATALNKNAITEQLKIPSTFSATGAPMAIDYDVHGNISLKINPRTLLAMENAGGRTGEAINKLLGEELVHAAETTLQKEDWQKQNQAYTDWLHYKTAGPAPKVPAWSFTEHVKQEGQRRWQGIKDALEAAPEQEKTKLYQTVLDSFDTYYSKDVKGAGALGMQAKDAGKIFDEIHRRGLAMPWAAEFTRQAQQLRSQGDISENTWIKIFNAFKEWLGRTVARLKEALPGVQQGKFGPELQEHVARIDAFLQGKGAAAPSLAQKEAAPSAQKPSRAAPIAKPKPTEKVKAPEKAKPKPRPKPETAEEEAGRLEARGAPSPLPIPPTVGGPFVKLKRNPVNFFRGMAEKLRRTPGLEFGGNAMLKHQDNLAAWKGELTAALPQVNTREVNEQVAQYWRDQLGPGPSKGTAPMPAHPDAERVVREQRRLKQEIKDRHQRLGLKDLGDESEYPMLLSKETLKAHQQGAGPHWQRLKDEMVAEGIIPNDPDPAVVDRAADVYLKKVEDQLNDHKSIAGPGFRLPMSAYEFKPGGFIKWATHAAERAALRDAFGSVKYTPPGTPPGIAGKNFFDRMREKTKDPKTKHQLDIAEALAYSQSTPNAWSEIIGVGTNFATGTQLGNVKSTEKNLLGALAGNITRWPTTFFKMRAAIQAIPEAKRRGLLQNHLFDAMNDINHPTLAGEYTGRFAGFMLKKHGYPTVEMIARSMGLVGARDELAAARKAYGNNPKSRRALQFMARVQRLGFSNPEALLQEAATGGPLADMYLRRAVNRVHGGYSYADVPLYLSGEHGGLYRQYGKFITEHTNMVYEDIAKPLLRLGPGRGLLPKETVEVTNPATGARETVKVPGEVVHAAMYLAAFAAAAGLWDFQEELVWDKASDWEKWTDMFTRMTQGEIEVFGDALTKLGYAMLNLGTFGFAGNFAKSAWDYARGKTDLGQIALDIPVAGMVHDGIAIVQDFLGRGDWTPAAAVRLSDQLLSLLSTYRAFKIPVARALNYHEIDLFNSDITAYKIDRANARASMRRMEDVLGMERTPRIPGIIPTAKTALKDKLNDLVATGRLAEARGLIKTATAELKDPKSKKELLDALEASTENKHPLGPGKARRELLMKEAKKRMTSNEYQRVLRIQKEYEKNAVTMGLMKSEGASSSQRRELEEKLQRRSKERSLEPSLVEQLMSAIGF